MKKIYKSGTIEYRMEYENYYRGVSSRIGMPAVIFQTGTSDWWFYLNRHRVNGEVREIKCDGDEDYKLGYSLYNRKIDINIEKLVI